MVYMSARARAMRPVHTCVRLRCLAACTVLLRAMCDTWCPVFIPLLSCTRNGRSTNSTCNKPTVLRGTESTLRVSLLRSHGFRGGAGFPSLPTRGMQEWSRLPLPSHSRDSGVEQASPPFPLEGCRRVAGFPSLPTRGIQEWSRLPLPSHSRDSGVEQASPPFPLEGCRSASPPFPLEGCRSAAGFPSLPTRTKRKFPICATVSSSLTLALDRLEPTRRASCPGSEACAHALSLLHCDARDPSQGANRTFNGRWLFFREPSTRG